MTTASTDRGTSGENIAEIIAKLSEGGAPSGTLGELRAWRDRLHTVLQFVTDAVAITDFTGAIVYINHPACALLGISRPSEVMGRGIDELYAARLVLDEQGRPVQRSELPGKSAYRGERASDTRLRFRDPKSATELVALVRTAPIWDHQRRVIASIQIFRDVTSEYRSRRQLELLATASGALAAAPDVPQAIEEIVRLPTAYVADWCFLDIVENGMLDRVAVACSDPRRAAFAQRLRGTYAFPEGDTRGLGAVLAEGEPRMVDGFDVSVLRGLFGRSDELVLLGPELRFLLSVPIIWGDRVRGALSLLSAGRRFDDADAALAAGLARIAASAIEHARLLRAEQRARSRATRLQEVTAALSAARTVRDVVEVACRVGAGAIEAATGRLWVPDSAGALTLAGSWQAEARHSADFPAGPGKEAAAHACVFRQRSALWIEAPASDARAAVAEAPGLDDSGALALLPLVAGEEAHGVVAFGFPERKTFDGEERGFISSVAEQCAQALDRARLLDEKSRLHAAAERAAQAAREAAERAESAGRIKDEFLAVVSHELRTPLNAILGWASLIVNRTHDDGMLEKGLASIQRNAAAQAKLVDDILDVSRIITGKLKLEPRLVDLVAIASEALDVIRPSAEAKRISLGFSCDVASCRVFGDPDRLRQAVWNLLSNAVKFSDQGASVALHIGMDGGSASLTVSDSGRGIEADFLPFVFERFVQADASTTRRYGGLGLGLAIVRHIVELHGGSVRAASEGPGRGAEFRIHLPLRSIALAGEVPAPKSDSGPQLASALQGSCILIVDDEPDARELLRVVLETHGAQVVAAQNVAEALAALQTQPVDAVVSDIAMPDRDGYAFVQELRLLRGRGSNAVPAVALTAYARGEDRRRALAAGFSAHVSKPIDAAELVAVLAELVSASKRPPVLT